MPNQTDFVLLNQMPKVELTLRWLTHSIFVWILFKKESLLCTLQSTKISKYTNLVFNLKQHLNCTEQPVSSPRSLYALHSRDLQSSGSRTCMSTQWGQIISEIKISKLIRLWLLCGSLECKANRDLQEVNGCSVWFRYCLRFQFNFLQTQWAQKLLELYI